MMRRHILCLLALAFGGVVSSAMAQTPNGAVPTIPVLDGQSAAFIGDVQMTQGQTYTAQRSVEVDCSVGGLIIFTLSDESTRTRQVYTGTNPFPYAITSWTLPGSGAAVVTGVFNMK